MLKNVDKTFDLLLDFNLSSKIGHFKVFWSQVVKGFYEGDNKFGYIF